MSRADTWMPLYIGDYLADTMHLEAREHGAYLLLIMHYWRNGPLPGDDRALSGIARVDRKTWVSDTGPIVRMFFVEADGRLHHKRIDMEREAAEQIADKKRAAANARWGKEKSSRVSTPDAGGSPPAHTPADAYASPDASAVDDVCTSPYVRGLPSPSPVEKKEPVLRTDAEASLDARSWVWSEGVQAVRGLTGLPEARAKSLVGKFAKASGDNCAELMRVIREAADLRPIDPVAWLTKALSTTKPALESSGDRLRRELGLDLPSNTIEGFAFDAAPRVIQ